MSWNLINLVFGIATSFVGAVVFFFLVRMIPYELWPKKYYRPMITNLSTILVTIWVFYTAFGTFGPRIELDAPGAHVPTVERTDVESGEEWSDTRDRFGEADERLRTMPTQPEEDEDEH